uniref:Uncharacterized protein n=1 Tax=Ciona savignyi TaxID=51511 RepID=H2YDX6_CIOSA
MHLDCDVTNLLDFSSNVIGRPSDIGEQSTSKPESSRANQKSSHWAKGQESGDHLMSLLDLDNSPNNEVQDNNHSVNGASGGGLDVIYLKGCEQSFHDESYIIDESSLYDVTESGDNN